MPIHPATVAIVGALDTAGPSHREIDAALPLLAAAGVSARWVDPAHFAATDPAGWDGLWFLTRGDGAAVTEGERAAYAVGHDLAAHGTPILTVDEATITPGRFAGPAADPELLAFVHSARAHAVVREQVMERRRIAAEEARPRTYVQQMRGPRHRWWRPLVALLVFAATWIVLAGILTTGFALGGQLADLESLTLGVGTNLWMNLTLAAFIPAALVATRVGHRRPWGRLLSVTGRVRWGWMLRAIALVTPVWVAYLTISWFVFGQEVMPRPRDWVGLLVVSLLTTPLQAAGEEVALRGTLVQAVGAWIRHPWAALGVSTVLSTVLFVALHGSGNVWIWIEIGAMAVAGCWLAWRTGGLEAAFALHIVNNVTVTVAGLVFGGLEASYVDETTTSTPAAALLGLVVMAVASALLLRAAGRRGIVPAGHLAPLEG